MRQRRQRAMNWQQQRQQEWMARSRRLAVVPKRPGPQRRPRSVRVRPSDWKQLRQAPLPSAAGSVAQKQRPSTATVVVTVEMVAAAAVVGSPRFVSVGRVRRTSVVVRPSVVWSARSRSPARAMSARSSRLGGARAARRAGRPRTMGRPVARTRMHRRRWGRCPPWYPSSSCWSAGAGLCLPLSSSRLCLAPARKLAQSVADQPRTRRPAQASATRRSNQRKQRMRIEERVRRACCFEQWIAFDVLRSMELTRHSAGARAPLRSGKKRLE